MPRMDSLMQRTSRFRYHSREMCLASLAITICGNWACQCLAKAGQSSEPLRDPPQSAARARCSQAYTKIGPEVPQS